jgi:uncharacterized protein YkwD
MILIYPNTSTCLLLITITCMLFACKKEKTAGPDDKDTMLMQVNTLRAQGCTCGTTYMPPVKLLKWNDTLALAAKAHATDMVANGYFSHISPSGTAPIQRTMALGYSGNYVTENIAKGYTDLHAVTDAWLKSETHCKAMMDSLQTEMGMAVVNTYWVQEFGSRR